MINKNTEIYCSFAKKAGNIGCQLFNSSFNYYGMDKIYKSFSVNNIKDAVNAVKTLNIKGFAVTMPFKTEVLDYVNYMSDGVKDIGAANTIINDGGILTAYNTDYNAAKEVLNECLGVDLYILGDGGYSKAVKQAATELGHRPIIITRENWNDIENIKNSIIYNCTPLENIKIDNSNQFIDCIVSTKTGKRLSWIQASHQFKLYTGKELPIRSMK
tara:strand:+ start:281 stop:925 length:645 start_codon:yes stop_codon:yes gene_type:complete